MLSACRYTAPASHRFDAIKSIERKDPKRALLEAQAEYYSARYPAGSYWHWKFRCLYAELLLMQGRGGESANLLKADPPAGPVMAEIQARVTAIRGRIAFMADDLTAAQRLFDLALSSVSAVPDPCWKAEMLTYRSSLLVESNQIARAEDSIAAAIPLADSCPDKYWKANLVATRANISFSQFRYEAAIPGFLGALDIAARENFNNLIGPLLGNIALCYYRLGDLDKALDRLNQTDAYYAKTGQLAEQETDIGDRGRVYELSRDYPKAIEAFHQALKIAGEFHNRHRQAQWLNELTLIYCDTGDLAAAEKANRQALALVDSKNDPETLAFSQLNSARIARLTNQLPAARAQLHELAGFAAGVGDPHLVWEIHAELARLLAGMRETSAARREFAVTLQTAESARGTIQDDWLKLTFSARILNLYHAYVDFLVDQGDAESALKIAEFCHARVLAERLGVSSPAQAQSLDFAKIARLKQAILLSYWVAPKRSFLWLTTPAGSQIFQLPGQAEIEHKIALQSSRIEARRDLLERGSIARELYGMLVAPAAGKLNTANRVIVIPDGPLCNLNFETLVPPAAPAHYWIEDAAVTVAPSLTLLLPAKEGGFHPDSLLLVGNATYADAEFPPLPGAARELNGIAARFAGSAQSRLLTGDNASPQGFKNTRPERFALIHFAAHAVANTQSPLDSAVILSGTKDNHSLYARDLAAMNLHAGLVTLSACRSAGARTLPGEGLVGFSWALLRAGAKNVIAGLWSVPDDTTAILMDRLYSHLYAGDSPAGALHAAKLEVMHQRPKPYYWAAFELYSR